MGGERFSLYSPGGKNSLSLYLIRLTTIFIRVALGVLFIWTGLLKLQQPYDFLWVVYDYELVNRSVGVAIAAALPWVELVLGISLVAGLLERGALLLSSFLLAVFTFARLSVASRELPIPCGCAGQGTQVISWNDVLQAALILVAAVMAFYGCLLTSLGRDQSIGNKGNE